MSWFTKAQVSRRAALAAAFASVLMFYSLPGAEAGEQHAAGLTNQFWQSLTNRHLPALTNWAPGTMPPALLKATTNYYRFGGTNHAQMRAAMQEARPWKNSFGFDAQTKWDVHSMYRMQREGDQFTVKWVDVNTTVVITLPWWIPGKPVPRELVERWNACVNGLSRHEQGHLVLAEAAGTELKKRLLALPPFSSPQELSATADRTVNDTIAEFRERDRRYDQVTRHGYTQGAIFPMSQADARAQAAAEAVAPQAPAVIGARR